MLEIGLKIKKSAKADRKIKKQMDKIIYENGLVSSRESLDNLIKICLACEIDCQEAIDVLNGAVDERESAIKNILLGYVNG